MVLSFGKVMDRNIRRLFFKTTNNRGSENNIANRTEPDNEDFFHGFFFTNEAPRRKQRGIIGIYLLSAANSGELTQMAPPPTPPLQGEGLGGAFHRINGLFIIS